MPMTVERVLLASPRGYCAGVERAVDTVELALQHYGAPVYVRKQIVHNIHVVRELEARGAIFVDNEEEVPPGSVIVFSAHGVAPTVYENSRALDHRQIDATCPLVTKVHSQAKRYAADGYTIVLIGHAGHEEVEGTMGEAPDSIILVESADDVEHLDVPEDARLVELEPARRGRPRPRRRCSPRRRRERDRGELARRSAHHRHYVRRLGTREAGRARVRLVPRPRRRGHLGVPADAGGR